MGAWKYLGGDDRVLPDLITDDPDPDAPEGSKVTVVVQQGATVNLPDGFFVDDAHAKACGFEKATSSSGALATEMAAGDLGGPAPADEGAVADDEAAAPPPPPAPTPPVAPAEPVPAHGEEPQQ